MKKTKCYRLMIFIGLLPVISLLLSCQCTSSRDSVSNDRPLIFGSLPDPHIGDYAIERECNINARVGNMFSYMQKRGCELVLVPGDWAEGHWEQEGPVKQWGEDPEKRVLPLCEKVHSCWLKHCISYNLRPIVAPGDHEYGDNPWPENKGRSRDFPFYRKGFGLAFNIDENGNSRHNGTIGDVPQRPVGTVYENTSYAEIHKNMLFVTLDLFRFDGPSVNLGLTGGFGTNIRNQGSVSGELTTDQEEWLDAVLAAGNKDKNVDFIIVQSHLPVKLPIYMYASSGLTVKDNENSSLWKLLKKHKVDIYIAGEVHAVTVLQDEETQLVQFIHGLWTFGIWTAEDNKLKIELFDEKDINQCLGTMVITKKGKVKVFEAEGAMKPLKTNDLLVHYTFDNSEQSSFFKNTGSGYAEKMKGRGVNVKQTTGILGQGALFAESDSSYVIAGDEILVSQDILAGDKPAYWAAAIMMTRVPRSMSAWIKTMEDGKNNTILSFASNPSMGLNMTMEDGRLALSSMGKTVLIAEDRKINDNKWHLVALTYQGEAASPATSRLFIDGNEIKATASEFEGDWDRNNCFVVGAVRTPPAFRIITNFPMKKVIDPPARVSNFFTGSIDDAALWYGALPASYMRAIYNAGINEDLKFNAADMKSLFQLYQLKSEGNVGGKPWRWAKCPEGAPGDILKVKDNYFIILDEQRNGVTTSK